MIIGDKALLRYYSALDKKTIYEVIEIKSRQDIEYINSNSKYFVCLADSNGSFGSRLDKLIN